MDVDQDLHMPWIYNMLEDLRGVARMADGACVFGTTQADLTT